MYKFQLEDVMDDIYVHTLDVCTAKCTVCKELAWTRSQYSKTPRARSFIGVRHLQVVNGSFYIVPLTHPKCIELFKLNPLAYVDAE